MAPGFSPQMNKRTVGINVAPKEEGSNPFKPFKLQPSFALVKEDWWDARQGTKHLLHYFCLLGLYFFPLPFFSDVPWDKAWLYVSTAATLLEAKRTVSMIVQVIRDYKWKNFLMQLEKNYQRGIYPLLFFSFFPVKPVGLIGTGIHYYSLSDNKKILKNCIMLLEGNVVGLVYTRHRTDLLIWHLQCCPSCHLWSV